MWHQVLMIATVAMATVVSCLLLLLFFGWLITLISLSWIYYMLLGSLILLGLLLLAWYALYQYLDRK